jgi:hypothetical protein
MVLASPLMLRFVPYSRLRVICAPRLPGRLWMSISTRCKETAAHTHTEARMAKTCASCDILLDVSCTNPACDGHHNDSRGDVCVYCATNEREYRLFLWEDFHLLCSSLAEIGHGED